MVPSSNLSSHVSAIFFCLICIFWLGCRSLDSSLEYSVRSGLAEKHEVIYYDVNGATASDLYQSMKKRKLTTVNGKMAYGYTSWRVDWDFDYAKQDGMCRGTNVHVTVASEMTLPRWEPGVDHRTSPLYKQWEHFIRTLKAHENQHKAHALSAGAEIAEVLIASADESCVVLRALAEFDAQMILRKYRDLDARYDISTRHGRREGTVWPPEQP